MKTAFVILSLFIAGAAFALSENFDLETGPALPEGWTASSTNWSVKGGALWKNGVGERQVAVIDKLGEGDVVTLEAKVMVRRREGPGWAIAGLSVRQDISNLWHFALVEAPPEKGAKHYVELLETLDGIRHAQNTNDTRLVCAVKEGNTFEWEYNKPYRMKLKLGAERIEGWMYDADGKQCARVAYLFENKRALKRGRAAVIVTNLVTLFDDFSAEVSNAK